MNERKCAAGNCPEPATMKFVWINFSRKDHIWAEWYCKKDWGLFVANIRVSADSDDFKKRRYARDLMAINNWFQHE